MYPGDCLRGATTTVKITFLHHLKGLERLVTVSKFGLDSDLGSSLRNEFRSRESPDDEFY